jgi:protein TonB
MFSTLLDSSPARTPVLSARHWAAAMFVGALGLVAGFVGLPLVSVPTPRALVAESLLLGVGLIFYELMLLYVLADARRLGLSVGKWSVILLVLNVVGFVAYLICAAIKTGDWKRAALPLAYILEGSVVCVLLLVPLIHTQALPNFRWTVMPTPPSPPPGRPPGHAPHVRAIRRAAAPATIIAPFKIPTHITFINDKPAAPPDVNPGVGPFVPGGIGQGEPDEVLSSILNGNTSAPPPPVPERRSTPQQRVHVGGVVEEAKLIYHPKPVYPPLAVISRTQGTVVLQAIIGKDGTIQDLNVISGNPLLVNAAVDAVARWRYQPTLLNGEPVEVVTEIEVKFILGD